MKIGAAVLVVLLGGSVWGCSEADSSCEPAKEPGSMTKELDKPAAVKGEEDDHWVTHHQAL